MAQPAARQGDVTSHGGTIAAGDPTVLINGMPAARQGDMHVCPMCSGTVPHVGGPILQGAPTVTINGMPAARQGDVCTCTGPPDAIVSGEPTVLIGSGGNPVKIGGTGPVMIGGAGPVAIGGSAAGGAGGGGGEAGRRGGLAAIAAAQAGTPEAPSREAHWLELKFEDAAGNPVSGLPYRLETSDGAVSNSWVKGEGFVRRSGLPEGTGTVTVTAVTDARWSASKAKVGETVTVTATAKGFEDGTPATVRIKEVPAEGGPWSVIDELETEVSGEEIEATWTYEGDGTAARPPDKSGAAQLMPAYAAEIDVEGYPLTPVTDRLIYDDDLEVELRRKENGDPLANWSYELRLSNGEIRTGTTDEAGRLREAEVPPGPYTFL